MAGAEYGLRVEPTGGVDKLEVVMRGSGVRQNYRHLGGPQTREVGLGVSREEAAGRPASGGVTRIPRC